MSHCNRHLPAHLDISNVELIRAYGVGSGDWLAKRGFEEATHSNLRLGFFDLAKPAGHDAAKGQVLIQFWPVQPERRNLDIT